MAETKRGSEEMKTRVILSSEEYGDEDFKYDTDEELLAGVARLYAECKKGSRKDGIEREIRIRIEPRRTPASQDTDDMVENFRAWYATFAKPKQIRRRAT